MSDDKEKWEVYTKSLDVTFGKPTLVAPKDPILRQVLPTFNFSDPPVNPEQFAMYLANAMLDFGGLGLAANQLGFTHRVCCIRAKPIIVMYNPVLVNESEDLVVLEEACLSFPDVVLKVKRPKSIRVRFTMPNGKVMTERYTGMTARVMQHEISHLNGEIFSKNVTRLEKLLAIKKANKHAKRKYIISDLI